MTKIPRVDRLSKPAESAEGLPLFDWLSIKPLKAVPEAQEQAPATNPPLRAIGATATLADEQRGDRGRQ